MWYELLKPDKGLYADVDLCILVFPASLILFTAMQAFHPLPSQTRFLHIHDVQRCLCKFVIFASVSVVQQFDKFLLC